jgi:cyclopropane-fatty-acyl-phospholipid synthase
MSFDSRTEILPLQKPFRGFKRYILERLFACFDTGRLTIITPSGERIEHKGRQPGPEAVLVVHRWRTFQRLVSGGDLGFGEAYIDIDWSSPDLIALIELGAQNIANIDRAFSGHFLYRLINKLRHILKSNSKAGSRRNIAFHYDLGNDFYRLWLDPSMVYSSGLYRSSQDTLEDAQDAKLSRVIELLKLRGGEKVLEIGCGWGALATRIARSGAQVTGLTLSSEQLAYAQNLVVQNKLTSHVDLRLQDYRDVEGDFDRIVSIEMLEAVGEQYWPIYFQTLRKRLKRGGLAILQVITIHEKHIDEYRRKTDFIQRYIFPGGMLPTKAIMAEQVARADLSLIGMETFGDSYAQTLAAWRERFLISKPTVESLGFGVHFSKLWEYYLAYCEAGFRTGMIDVGLYSIEG